MFTIAFFFSPSLSFIQLQAKSISNKDYQWKRATESSNRGDYLNAAKSFLAFASTESEMGMKAYAYIKAGESFYHVANYNDSKNSYSKALEIYKRLESNIYNSKQIINILNIMGEISLITGEFDEADDLFSSAFSKCNEINSKSLLILTLRNIANLYSAWGKDNEALNVLNSALSISEGKEQFFETKLLIAHTHFSLENYSSALEIYEEANIYFYNEKDGNNYSSTLFYMANSCWGMGDILNAEMYFLQSLNYFKRLANSQMYISCLSTTGTFYLQQLNYSKALQIYQTALAISEKFNYRNVKAEILYKIGKLYRKKKSFNKALEFLFKALKEYENGKNLPEIANVNNEIGEMNIDYGKYAEAIDALNKSVLIKEKLRKTATGYAKRDYLDSQMHTYENLVWAYFKNSDFINAFHAIELSRAKLLAEQIGYNTEELKHLEINTIQESLPSNGCILLYEIIHNKTIIVLLLNKDKLIGFNLGNFNPNFPYSKKEVKFFLS